MPTPSPTEIDVPKSSLPPSQLSFIVSFCHTTEYTMDFIPNEAKQQPLRYKGGSNQTVMYAYEMLQNTNTKFLLYYVTGG